MYQFEDRFSGKLAIFCSDERFVKATLDFLKKNGFDSCDLMVVAGGPLFMEMNEENLVERLNALIELHNIKDIILISHENCGYYRKVYHGLDDEELKNLQKSDLRKIYYENAGRGLNIKGYFASIQNGEIVFEKVI